VILGKIGTALKKNTKTKIWWLKLGIALILSNVFFFLLFSGDKKQEKTSQEIPDGWVEIQLEAHLMTPFQNGKKVLIIQRKQQKKIEAVLKELSLDEMGRITVLVREEEAAAFFHYSSWEVLPYLKHLTFAAMPKGKNHEIRY
jgi:hypothetical protein